MVGGATTAGSGGGGDTDVGAAVLELFAGLRPSPVQPPSSRMASARAAALWTLYVRFILHPLAAAPRAGAGPYQQTPISGSLAISPRRDRRLCVPASRRVCPCHDASTTPHEVACGPFVITLGEVVEGARAPA